MVKSVLVALVFLLSGCAQIGITDPASESGSIQILARFTPEKLGFELRSSDVLPSGLKMRFVGDGVEEEVQAGGIQGLGTAKGIVESPVAFQEHGEYSVAVLMGGDVLAERTFTFYHDESFEPKNDVRATYELEMSEDDGSFRMAIKGTATMEQTDGRFLMSMRGSGSASADEDGFSMDLNIDEFSVQDEDDVTTGGHMHASGTWKAQGGFSGNGDVETMRFDFLGREVHRDSSGRSLEGEKERMFMHMTGVMEGSTMEMETEETTWSDPETGRTFWRKGYEEYTFTVEGETYPEREEFDEPVSEQDDSDESLTDMLPEVGPTLWPLAVGDTFVHEGSEIRVEHTVLRGPPRTVDGTTVSTWAVEGEAIAGASGSTSMLFVAEGFVEGLPVTMDDSYTRGDLAASFKITLVRAG